MEQKEWKTANRDIFHSTTPRHLTLPICITVFLSISPPQDPPSCFPYLLFSLFRSLSLSFLPLSSCSLSQQVDWELLTGLIQTWWHAAASGTQSWELTHLLLALLFPPAYLSIITTPPLLHFVSPCLCHFCWEVSDEAYYTPLTLIEGRGMCRFSLNCSLLPLPLFHPPSCPLTPASSLFNTDTHTHWIQTISGLHTLFLPISNTPQEWALTQLRGSWR